jgi:sporulation protein YlmC with PRC-barrel domain
MQALKLVRLMGAMAVVASAPALLAVMAHAQTPASPSTESQPGTLPPPRPEMPTRPQQADPGKPSAPPTMDQKPAAGAPGRTPTAPGGQAATEGKKDPLVGLAVFGSDGQKIGEVRDVKAAADGKVEEIHVRTGGMLGFGGKTVAIPAAKFNKSGQNVQLALTSDDVSKLPKLDEKPS